MTAAIRLSPRCSIVLLLALLAACGQQRAPITISGAAQGTQYHVTVTQMPHDLDAAQIRAAMRDVIDTIDRQMSSWRDDSELSRFNAAPANQWIEVSPALASLVSAAADIGYTTDGAFDITVQPVLSVWGFGPGVTRPTRMPDREEIASAREKTGLGLLDIRTDPPALRKKKTGVELDIAGLAQGYTVDRMAQHLDRLGAEHYLVELGGGLFARGSKQDDQPWQIGVEKPAAARRVVDRVVRLEDQGMTTSGDYRDFFEIDGHRYSHTIDPRTGRPVAHDLRAVTAIADNAMQADAMATALLVMGPKAGLAYANANDIAAFFVQGDTRGYTRKSSQAFQPYLETRQ